MWVVTPHDALTRHPYVRSCRHNERRSFDMALFRDAHTVRREANGLVADGFYDVEQG